MCLLAVIEAGATLPESVREIATHNNGDGFGFAYVNAAGRIRMVKAAKPADALFARFRNAQHRYGRTRPMLAHWRLASCGDVCDANAQPFMLADGGAMAHNGTLYLPGQPAHKSDTRHLADAALSKMPRGWYRHAGPRFLLDALIGTDRMALLYPDDCVIIGEDRGKWCDGVWYSNESGHTPYYWYGGGMSWTDDDPMDRWEAWRMDDDLLDNTGPGTRLTAEADAIAGMLKRGPRIVRNARTVPYVI